MVAANDPIMHWYPYQRAWLADESRFKVGCMARQVGKTFTGCGEIVRDCVKAEIAGKKCPWVILSRGERQAREAMSEGVKPLLQAYSALYQNLKWQQTDLEYTTNGIRYQGTQISLPGGSRITALPATADTARGFSANVFLDEFAFHADSRGIWAALVPVISAGYKLRVVSTPNGRGNKFYELMHTAPNWSRHQVPLAAAVAQGLPRNIAELKTALNDELMWRQEFNCEFIDGASAFLSYDLIDGCEHPDAGIPAHYQGKPCYLGNDIALRRDLFTLVCLEELGDVLWCREFFAKSKVPFWAQYDLRAAWFERYRVARMAIDQTGMGEETVEREQRKYGTSLVTGVLFNPGRKLMLANALKERMEDRRLRLPADPALRADLHSLRRTASATGAPILNVDQSQTDGHGDRFWALALANGTVTAGAGLATGWQHLAMGAPPGGDTDESSASRWHQGAW